MSGSVIVVGSLSADFVLSVPRRPGKGETIIGTKFETFLGGKGNNQALAAARAGSEVHFVGKVGADQYGDRIAETLQASFVSTEYLFYDMEVGTGIANIYVEPNGDNSIVIVPQANARLSAADVNAAKPAFESAKILLLQMEIPDETVLRAAKLAKEHGLSVVLNPAPAPASGRLPAGLLALVDYLIPNQSEAEQLTGIAIVDEASTLAAARKLQKLGASTVIITLGESGAQVLEANGTHTAVPAFSVKVVDSTAAGDAFCGALASGLAAGKALIPSVAMACAAGALACTRAGAEPSLPKAAEINQLLATLT